jgi:hypothetical protein
MSTPATQSTPRTRTDFDPVAGVAAVLVPGAGHFLRGERLRAAHIAAGVLGLFVVGLLIGGIGVVDRRDNYFWFIPQGIVGPAAFGVDYLHQNHFKVRDDLHGGRPRALGPGEKPRYRRSLGKSNELGTLFCAIAGMVNLIVIIDAAFPTRRLP